MAAMIAKPPQQVSGDDKCHLLDSPPEVRNRIYDYLFAIEPTADLLTVTPPEKALIVTCRQIYEEAKHMYRVRFRAFWMDTTFETNLVESPETVSDLKLEKRIADIDERNIVRIKKIQFTSVTRFSPTKVSSIEMSLDGDLWICRPDRESGLPVCYMMTAPHTVDFKHLPQPNYGVLVDPDGRQFPERIVRSHTEAWAKMLLKGTDRTGRLTKDGLITMAMLVGRWALAALARR